MLIVQKHIPSQLGLICILNLPQVLTWSNYIIMYNKLPNTNKMQWEKVQTLSLFFQFTGIENNLLHYFNFMYTDSS